MLGAWREAGLNGGPPLFDETERTLLAALAEKRAAERSSGDDRAELALGVGSIIMMLVLFASIVLWVLERV